MMREAEKGFLCELLRADSDRVTLHPSEKYFDIFPEVAYQERSIEVNCGNFQPKTFLI